MKDEMNQIVLRRVTAAETEARRFLAIMPAVRSHFLNDDAAYQRSSAFARMKQASLDLSIALRELRKSPYQP